MATATTDVRVWLREQGHEIGDRGRIPDKLRDEYNQAHPGQAPPAGPGPDGAYDITTAADPDYDGGVSGADFGPDPEPDVSRETPAGGEQRPRPVKPKGRFSEKLFGGRHRKAKPGPGTGAKRKSPRAPRVSLGDFAEDTWADLAWLASPIPPLAKMLQLQAPYAGVVIEDAVKGTFMDAMLQPVARYHGTYQALNGLAGPPVFVAAICASGRRDPDTGEFDARTQMMFAGLRYCLLQMTKVSDNSLEQIQERTAGLAERTRVVDAIIADLFGFVPDGGPPEAPPEPPAPPPGPGWSAEVVGPVIAPNGRHAFSYPDPPAMDDTGADPGRALAVFHVKHRDNG